MDGDRLPSADAFRAIRNGDITGLVRFVQASGSSEQLRPFLAYLVRCVLCSGNTAGCGWLEREHSIIGLLSGLEVVNAIVACLAVDFSELLGDLAKERRLREKEINAGIGSEVGASASVQHGLTVEFEEADLTRKLRLLLREMLRMALQVCCSNA